MDRETMDTVGRKDTLCNGEKSEDTPHPAKGLAAPWNPVPHEMRNEMTKGRSKQRKWDGREELQRACPDRYQI